MNRVADVVSAAAFGLAAIAMFYSLWSPAFDEALKITIKKKKEDRGPQLNKLRETSKSKATPLAIVLVVYAGLLTPASVSIVWRSGENIERSGVHALADYDTQQALFLFVWLLAAFLAYLTNRIRKKLTFMIKKAEGPDV